MIVKWAISVDSIQTETMQQRLLWSLFKGQYNYILTRHIYWKWGRHSMLFTWASFPNGPVLTQSSLSPLVIMLCFPMSSTTDKSNYVKHVWETPLGLGFSMMGRFSESKNKPWFSRDLPSMCSMTNVFLLISALTGELISDE